MIFDKKFCYHLAPVHLPDEVHQNVPKCMPNPAMVPSKYHTAFSKAVHGACAFVNVDGRDCVVGYGYGTESAACLAISP